MERRTLFNFVDWLHQRSYICRSIKTITAIDERVGRAQQRTLFIPALGRTMNTTTAIEDEVFTVQSVRRSMSDRNTKMHAFMNMNGENLSIIRITQWPH